MTGSEFRAELKRLGLSQRELAGRFGMPPSTVNRWAMGESPVPGYAVEYLRVLSLLRDLESRLRAA